MTTTVRKTGEAAIRWDRYTVWRLLHRGRTLRCTPADGGIITAWIDFGERDGDSHYPRSIWLQWEPSAEQSADDGYQYRQPFTQRYGREHGWWTALNSRTPHDIGAWHIVDEGDDDIDIAATDPARLFVTRDNSDGFADAEVSFTGDENAYVHPVVVVVNAGGSITTVDADGTRMSAGQPVDHGVEIRVVFESELVGGTRTLVLHFNKGCTYATVELGEDADDEDARLRTIWRD
jgi:hypothetical protein